MKINVNCEQYKASSKEGVKPPCNCKYLNRNFHREMKYYRSFMKNLKKVK